MSPLTWLRARQEKVRLIQLDNDEAEARRREADAAARGEG